MTHDEEAKMKAAMSRLAKEVMPKPGGGTSQVGVYSVGIGKEDDEYVLRISCSSWKVKQMPKTWEGYRVVTREGSQGRTLDHQPPKWPDDFRGFGSNVQPAKKEDKLHGGQTVDF